MYLSKKIYIGANYQHNNITGEINIRANGKTVKVNLNRVTDITESVGYWRKANQIHQWFVEQVQDGEDDCGDYYVDNDKLKELLVLCEYVLKDHDKAPELLPSASGFFFGGTEYNTDYFEDLEYTAKTLKTILEEDPDGNYYYHSSW